MDRVLCQGFAFDFPGSYDDGFLKVQPPPPRMRDPCPPEKEGASQQVISGLPLLTKLPQSTIRVQGLHG